MSFSRRQAAFVAALFVAACGGRGVPPSFAPEPSRIDPAGGPTNVDAAVTIYGTHFYARGVQSLSRNGGISESSGGGPPFALDAHGGGADQPG